MSNTTNLRSQLAYQVIQEVQKAVIGKGKKTGFAK